MPQLWGRMLGIVSLEEVIWLSSSMGVGWRVNWTKSKPGSLQKIQFGVTWIACCQNGSRSFWKSPLKKSSTTQQHGSGNFVNKTNETISTSHNVELGRYKFLHPGILASSGSSTITGRTMKRWWRKNDGKKIPRKLDSEDPNGRILMTTQM